MKFTGERINPSEEECNVTTDTYKEHAARYEFAAKFVNGKKVLDAACGVGYGSKILSEAGAFEVHGVDISNETITYAKQKYSQKSIQFHAMDISRLNFPDHNFHYVISYETIEHIKNYKQVIREFARVLKDSGTLIISTPNVEAHSVNEKNPYHFKEFSKDEFVTMLKSHFKRVDLYSQRLVTKPSVLEMFLKNILKIMILAVKIDFLKIHSKFFKPRTYSSVYTTIVKKNERPDVFPYQNSHLPRNFIAICQK